MNRLAGSHTVAEEPGAARGRPVAAAAPTPPAAAVNAHAAAPTPGKATTLP